MTWTLSKGNQQINAHPRNLSWIAVSVGVLALFLTLGCMILVSNPIGYTVRGYLYTVDNSKQLDVSLDVENPVAKFPRVDNVDDNVLDESNSKLPTRKSGPSDDVDKNFPIDTSLKQSEIVAETKESNDRVVVTVVSTGSSTDDNGEIVDENVSHESNQQVPLSSTPKSNPKMEKDPEFPLRDGLKDGSLPNTTGNDIIGDSKVTEGISSASYLDDSSSTSASKADSGCDLYQGSWIHDSVGPLYTNNTCPVLTPMQNCQGNGRPDKDYENWRWKPEKCDLPRFNARKFLELMRGKTIAFIGDSVARNQMESLMCMLWQEEVPKNRGSKKMQRYYFKSTSTMVVRIWSSWLVKHTTEPEDLAPGVAKLHLDAPDDTIMENFLKFNVIVLSSGHWFAKQSVYLLNNKTVGGQLWWPDRSKPMKINNVEAFGISVETILTSFVTHPSYKGLTIVRSFSPDHYEGGAWNTGGSCTGKTKPLAVGKVVENGFTNAMLRKQVTGFNRAIKKTTNKSKMRLMDITKVFEYRHDGHPGPYRSKDPNKLTKRGPDGKPPPQDCLHWCMPGPVDTWNELVLELIRREYDDSIRLTL